jgi:DNA-binding transcriptional LysR family regulator
MDKHRDRIKNTETAPKRHGAAHPKRPTSWFLYEIFFTVAQAGTFYEAERVSGFGFHYLSKLITQLEKECGVTLFSRLNDGMRLTVAGKELFKHIQKMHFHAEKADIALRWVKKSMMNHLLTVGAPNHLGNSLIGLNNDKIQDLYPDLLLELVIKDNPSLISMAHYDCALYAGDIGFSKYESTYLYTEELGIYASEDYLLTHGTPKNLDDMIDHHALLVLRKDDFTSSKDIPFLNMFYNHVLTGNFISNSETSLLRDISAGKGLGVLDHAHSLHHPIKRVLPQHSQRGRPVYLIYSKHNKNQNQIKMIEAFLLNLTKNLRHID